MQALFRSNSNPGGAVISWLVVSHVSGLVFFLGCPSVHPPTWNQNLRTCDSSKLCRIRQLLSSSWSIGILFANDCLVFISELLLLLCQLLCALFFEDDILRCIRLPNAGRTDLFMNVATGGELLTKVLISLLECAARIFANQLEKVGVFFTEAFVNRVAWSYNRQREYCFRFQLHMTFWIIANASMRVFIACSICNWIRTYCS